MPVAEAPPNGAKAPVWDPDRPSGNWTDRVSALHRGGISPS